MTTTSRIRWERNEDDNSLTGRAGTMTEPVFWIWPPEAPGKAHILTSSLPGHDKDFYPNGFVSDVKAKAEEWLAEHVASLGATFGDEPDCPAAPSVTIDMHRWYAIITDGSTVLGVIGVQGRDGLGLYESKEEWERVNG